MSDYKERFEKWQKGAKEKFEKIDEQLGIKDKLEEGARVVVETAQKSAEKIKSEAEKTEAGKQAVRAAEATIRSAEDAAKKAWTASEPIREAAEDAGEKAADVAKEVGKTAGNVINSAGKMAGQVIEGAFDTAAKGAKTVGNAFSLGATWSRTIDSALSAVNKTTSWIQEKPLQAVATGASMAVGAGIGVVFTGISSHWLFNSALPAWSVKKLTEQFNGYLKKQQELIDNGDLSEAEAERVRFERDLARRIGAPLLGAFSFASGAVMMTNVLNPKTVTGAPISWLLGGNPMLESVWFFGNGIVCLKTSYDLFMIALEDQHDVQQIVREIKGLLPQAA